MLPGWRPGVAHLDREGFSASFRLAVPALVFAFKVQIYRMSGSRALSLVPRARFAPFKQRAFRCQGELIGAADQSDQDQTVELRYDLGISNA